MTLMRLQRALARAGVTSRRKAEDLIRAGRVRVDGVVASLGVSVDTDRPRLAVHGRVVRARSGQGQGGGEGSRHRSGADPRGGPAAYRAPPGRAAGLEGGMAAPRRLRAGATRQSQGRRVPRAHRTRNPGDRATAWTCV